MACLPKYELIPSDCPCLLKYLDVATGREGSINLHGAKTIPFPDGTGFQIYGQGQGLKVSDESDFTLEDVDTLICECHGSGGGSGTATGPASNVVITNPISNAVDVDGNTISDSGIETVIQGTPTVKPIASQGRVTPEFRESTSTGTTLDGIYEFSISNIGSASGTLSGVTFPVGATVSYTAHHDVGTGTYKLLNSLEFDASGTIFLISETV